MKNFQKKVQVLHINEIRENKILYFKQNRANLTACPIRNFNLKYLLKQKSQFLP